MLSRKNIVAGSVVLVVVVVSCAVFIWFTARSLQKDTCRRTIESSFARFLTEDRLLKGALTSEWADLSPDARAKLLYRAKAATYTECASFGYLVEGVEKDGNPLPVYARIEPSEKRVEVKFETR